MSVIGTSHWLLGLPRLTYGTTGPTWLLGLPRQEIFPSTTPTGFSRYGNRRKKETMNITQSTTFNFPIFMYDSADHISGKTGLTLTISASKNGATASSITPTVTEIGNGRYSLALTTSHTDTLGSLGLLITSSGADPMFYEALVTLAPALDSTVAKDATVSKPGTAQTISSNADITAIKAKTDNLPASPAAVSDIPSASTNAAAVRTNLTTELSRIDVSVSTRSAPGTAQTITAPADMALNSTVAKDATVMKSASYTAPDNVSITAIKLKTDNLPASPAAVGSAMTLASGAITAAVIATDAIDADAIATDAITEIQSGLSRPGTAQTITAPADMALNSTVAKESTLSNRPTLAQIEASTVLAMESDIPSAATIADAVWDEILTGATHNIQNSAGRRVRQLAQTIISSDISQGPGVGQNQILLASTESSVDGTFDPAIIAIVTGTGEGQCRRILEYKGSTRAATVNRNWKVAPDATSEYIIYADAGGQSSNEGLLRAATSNTVQLNTLASSVNNAYVGQTVWIVSGTGDDQAKMIVSYVGSTKIATIDGTWAVTPDTTSAYILLPTASIMLGDGQAEDLAAIKAKTDNLPADPAATSDIPSAASITDSILDEILVPGLTVRLAIELIGTLAASKKSGMVPGQAGTTIVRKFDDSGVLIEAVQDANGNTTDVTVTP